MKTIQVIVVALLLGASSAWADINLISGQAPPALDALGAKQFAAIQKENMSVEVVRLMIDQAAINSTIVIVNVDGKPERFVGSMVDASHWVGKGTTRPQVDKLMLSRQANGLHGTFTLGQENYYFHPLGRNQSVMVHATPSLNVSEPAASRSRK